MHGLRSVDAYALNADGTSSVDFENKIRTSSHWILNENSTGQADISMSIDDLFKQTEGRIVFDPSTVFQEGVNGYTGCQDSFLYINENETPDRTDYNYGASTTLALWAVILPNGTHHSETRPIIRFKDMDAVSGLGKGLIITDAAQEIKSLSTRHSSRSNGTINRERSELRRLLNWALQTGMIKKSIPGFSAFKRGKPPGKNINGRGIEAPFSND